MAAKEKKKPKKSFHYTVAVIKTFYTVTCARYVPKKACYISLV